MSQYTEKDLRDACKIARWLSHKDSNSATMISKTALNLFQKVGKETYARLIQACIRSINSSASETHAPGPNFLQRGVHAKSNAAIKKYYEMLKREYINDIFYEHLEKNIKPEAYLLTVLTDDDKIKARVLGVMPDKDPNADEIERLVKRINKSSDNEEEVDEEEDDEDEEVEDNEEDEPDDEQQNAPTSQFTRTPFQDDHPSAPTSNSWGFGGSGGFDSSQFGGHPFPYNPPSASNSHFSGFSFQNPPSAPTSFQNNHQNGPVSNFGGFGFQNRTSVPVTNVNGFGFQSAQPNVHPVKDGSQSMKNEYSKVHPSWGEPSNNNQTNPVRRSSRLQNRRDRPTSYQETPRRAQLSDEEDHTPRKRQCTVESPYNSYEIDSFCVSDDEE